MEWSAGACGLPLWNGLFGDWRRVEMVGERVCSVVTSRWSQAAFASMSQGSIMMECRTPIGFPDVRNLLYFLILLGSHVPLQYIFLSYHSLELRAKLRGKIERLMLALPSIFPSRTTHGHMNAGKARVNMKGCVL